MYALLYTNVTCLLDGMPFLWCLFKNFQPLTSCHVPWPAVQERAYSMLASRAYVHQYEQYGLSVNDFNECFAHVEEIMERYASL